MGRPWARAYDVNGNVVWTELEMNQDYREFRAADGGVIVVGIEHGGMQQPLLNYNIALRKYAP